MANIEVDFGMVRRERPAAIVSAYRSRAAEAQPAAIRRNNRAQYSRIEAGQLVRAVLLVLLCLGAARIFHSGHAQAAKATSVVLARSI